MIVIVGGGLAAVSLAKVALEAQIPFRIYIDKGISASRVSSGILNPITGRKYALAWEYERFKEAAILFYGDFLKSTPIRRHYKPYAEGVSAEEAVLGKENYCHVQAKDWIYIQNSFQLRVNAFMDYWLAQFQSSGSLVHGRFDSETLLLEDQSYEGQVYDQIIYAEGIGLSQNPFFSEIAHQANRGQAILVSAPDLKLTEIVQKGKFICPFGDKFWIGSSFEKLNPDKGNTNLDFLKDIQDFLPDLLPNTSYNITDHIGAFRVTTPDRKPLIGRHPDHSFLWLFNGFGTKGCSLIPYYALSLMDHIQKQTPLDPLVDLRRFQSKESS